MSRFPSVWRPDRQENFAGPALIDTHIWIWYLDAASGQMSARAVDLLRQCIRREGLFVSDISGFSFLPLDRGILLLSTELPGAPHGDPVDRMLIASAMLAGIPLVTADQLIVDYAASQEGISVCDARP